MKNLNLVVFQLKARDHTQMSIQMKMTPADPEATQANKTTDLGHMNREKIEQITQKRVRNKENSQLLKKLPKVTNKAEKNWTFPNNYPQSSP